MTANGFRLSGATGIGYVQLRVSDAEQSVSFYQDLLGLRETKRQGSSRFLASGEKNEPLIVLTEDRNAVSRPQLSTGLFHVAILYPSRKELARVFKRLYESGWPFQGFADHGVSEALYLTDPEGNGIELYADRPRNEWQFETDGLQMMTEPLDLDSLVSEIRNDSAAWEGAHSQTRIGHVHLSVSDLRKAEHFYHETLGFDVTQRTTIGALFVSAGGYHHHIGLNTWTSMGAPPASPDARGLIRFGLVVPLSAELEALRMRFETAGLQVVENQNGGGEPTSLLVRDPDRIEIEVFAARNKNH